MKLFLDSFNILTGAGIHTDNTPALDEHGYADLGAGFNLRRLCSAGGAVVFCCRTGFHDFHFNKCRQFYVKNRPVIGKNDENHDAVLEKARRGADGDLRNVDLVEGIGIHHHEVGAVAVEVLVLFAFGYNQVYRFRGAEPVLDIPAGFQVLHIRLVESPEIARRAVDEAFDNMGLSLEADDGPFGHIADGRHRRSEENYGLQKEPKYNIARS